MTGESHAPGLMTFVVPKDDAAKLAVGKTADVKDTRGDPVQGAVTRVEHANRASIVVVKTGG